MVLNKWSIEKKRGGGELKMKECGDNWVKGGETYLLS